MKPCQASTWIRDTVDLDKLKVPIHVKLVQLSSTLDKYHRAMIAAMT